MSSLGTIYLKWPEFRKHAINDGFNECLQLDDMVHFPLYVLSTFPDVLGTSINWKMDQFFSLTG